MIPHKKQDWFSSEPKKLRYGVLFADRKSKQIVIASMDGRAAVYILQWAVDYPMLSLYEDGLLSADADIILDHIAANETVKARTRFRYHFDDGKPQCRNESYA